MTGETPSAAQLQGISDSFVRALAALGRLRTYPKNTVFITEGDSSDSVFVILAGRVKVFISDSEGHEMILDTQGPHLTYQPERLSMERVDKEAFSPLDRVGQLQMRNLDILDSREKLAVYARTGVLPAGPGEAGLLGSDGQSKKN